MKRDTCYTDNASEPTLSKGVSALLHHLDAFLVKDILGLALYIAWSFVFWNGSLLFESVRGETIIGQSQIVQAAFTAVAALAIALSATSLSLRRRAVCFGVLSLVSSVAMVAGALSGYGDAPSDWMVAAFALSGIGSAFRLGWEERLSVRGVGYTAVGAALSYLVGFGLFVSVSALPSFAALVVSAFMPLVAWGLMFVPRAVESAGDPEERLRCDEGDAAPTALLRRVPWKLMIALALTFFGYGATRVGGVAGGFEATGIFHSVSPGTPALASCSAIILAWLFYRWKPIFALYLAFPLIAVASVVPVSLDPLAGATLFCTALVGAELVKYLVWFFMIDSIMKRDMPALFCLAVMRFSQWAGSCLGQIGADVLEDTAMVTIAVLISLMVALLILIGFPFSESGEPGALSRDSGASDPSRPEEAPPSFERRVRLLSERYRLSPREYEVLSIWVTGHTAGYIEEKLVISKSTVKTHLNHIYSKTGTTNRDELLRALEDFG